MATIPKVRVRGPDGGPMNINESDFDPATHRKWEDSAPAPTQKAETASEYRVKQSGSWHKLIGPDGEQVGKAQRSEDEAWALLEEDET